MSFFGSCFAGDAFFEENIELTFFYSRANIYKVFTGSLFLTGREA